MLNMPNEIQQFKYIFIDNDQCDINDLSDSSFL